MSRRLVHVITPGDHYSPRTGSAIATVVHGQCSATHSGAPRPAVVVGACTYADRYDDAEVVEYAEAPPLSPRGRKVEALAAMLRLPRAGMRAVYAAALAGQRDWEPSVVLVHNGPQGIPLVDPDRHVPVLYAHNQLLRTYSSHEAGRTLEGAAAIVCVSDHLAQATSDRLPPSLRDRVRVVRNGVDSRTLLPAERVPGPVLEVVFLGRTVPDKGAHVLLRAVRRLVDDGRRDVHVSVVGSSGFSAQDALTPYELSLRALVRELGDAASLSPFVPRSQAHEVLRGADVVVVPSVWQEPFTLTALEGMAAGAAVVASEVGGIPEAVGGAGLLVPPGDVEALAREIAGLADDRARLAQARAAGRAWAEANDWTEVLRRLGTALDLR